MSETHLFKKGRKKTGGRVKGTANKEKIKLDVLHVLTEMGHEPAAEQIKIFREAMSEYTKKKKQKNSWGAGGMLETARMANSELMRYCYPTKKAIEHSGPNGGPMEFKTYNDIVKALGGQVDDDAE